MTRKVLLLILAILFAIPAFCQESDSKKINKVKRNSQYLYAEATMKDPVEAYNTAIELLNGYIDEYVQTKKKYKSSENIIVKDMETKTDKIQMKRGEMTRVFVYVKKSDIIPAENSMVRENAGKREESKPLESTVTPIPAETDETRRLTVAWQQEIVDNLLACTTLIEAKALLNRQKSEFKVKRIGSMNNCRNKAECFWVIGDESGALVTVLGPGTTERTNFKQLQTDALENYPTASAIWFTMSK